MLKRNLQNRRPKLISGRQFGLSGNHTQKTQDQVAESRNACAALGRRTLLKAALLRELQDGSADGSVRGTGVVKARCWAGPPRPLGRLAERKGGLELTLVRILRSLFGPSLRGHSC